MTRTSFLLSSATLCLALGATASCESLPELTRNTCGNRIIERGEDCDGTSVGANTCNGACRLECGADRACPPGWGCGADDLCRQPAGGFEALGTPLGLTANQLLAGDFDGDRRNDLLAVTGLSVAVAYVDPEGLFPIPSSLGVSGVGDPPNIPAVGDLDGDGAADVVVRAPSGLALFAGRPDRTFSPRPFSRTNSTIFNGAELEPDAEVRWIDIDSRADAVGREIIAIRSDGIYLLADNHPEFEDALPAKIVAWDGPKPFVSLDRSFLNAFLIAPEGGTSVTVHPFNGPDGLNDDLTAPVTYTVTIPGPVGGPPRVQRNQTGNSNYGDLLVPGSADGAVAYIAFCSSFNSPYEFHSATTLNPPMAGDPQLSPNMTAVAITMVDDSGEGLTGSPLYIGGVDNTNRSWDVVLPDGIWVTACNELPCEVPQVAGEPMSLVMKKWYEPLSLAEWTFALPATSNPENLGFSDGINLALGEPGGGFTYVRQGAFGLPQARFVASQGEITAMNFTNIDGDARNDFIFAQRSGDGTRGLLQVSFGDEVGFPTEPFLNLGEVGTVAQIIPFLFFEDGETPDGVLDLLVRTVDDGTQSTLEFRGSLDRNLQAPLDLPGTCLSLAALESGSERLVAMGDFDGDGQRDLGVVFRTADGNALYSATPTGSVADDVCASLAGPAPITLADTDEARMLPIDLDGDGREELAILGLADADETTLTLASESGGSWTTEEISLSGRFRGMTTGDFGVAAGLGDDLILWTDEGVWVLWNDGTGSLSTAAASFASVAGLPCIDRGTDVTFGTPLAAAPVQLGGDFVRELLVTSADDAVSLSVDPATRALTAPTCATGFLDGGATALASDDVNGDGVEDVVVSRASGTRILAGIAINP